MSDSSQDSTKSLKQLLINIFEDNSIPVKVSSINSLFKNHGQLQNKQDFEKFSREILAQVLPEVTSVQKWIFQHNDELVAENMEADIMNCSDILNELQVYLQLSIDMLKIIDDFLTSLAKIGVLTVDYYCFIPVNMNHLVCATFYHCQESQRTYRQYFDKVQLLPALFQATQAIYNKVLIIMETQFVFQAGIQLHQELLLEFMECLCDNGNILFGLNTKLMVTTWKCYANIIKQYGAALSQFDINKSLSVLFPELSLSLKKIIDAQITDNQSFKICNFLLRVVTTIIFTCWSQCTHRDNSSTLFGYITSLYKITSECDPHSDKAKQRDLLVFVPLDTILIRLFIDSTVLIMEDLREYHECQGFMIVVKSVMLRAKLCNTFNVTCNILIHFLQYLDLNHGKQTGNFAKTAEYNMSLANFAAICLGVSTDEFYAIEKVLFNVTFQEASPSSLFGCDLWVLILSLAPPTLCFNTLTALAEKLKHRASRDFYRGACHQLRIFLRRCFALLPDTLKIKWIESYTSEANLHLWVLFSIGEVMPPRRRAYLAQVVCKNVCIRSGLLDFEALQYSMDGLEVLSTLCVMKEMLPADNQQKLNTLIAKLFRPDADLLQCRLYSDQMSQCLLPCIINFIRDERLDNAHLYQLLSRLVLNEALPPSPAQKLIISAIITPLAKCSPNEYNALIFSIVSKLLQTLDHLESSPTQPSTAVKALSFSPVFSQNSNSVDSEFQLVNLYANAARHAFESNAEWMKNLANVSSSGINPPQPEPVDMMANSNEGSLPKAKKIKLQKVRPLGVRHIQPLRMMATVPSPEDEVDEILENMKDGVKRLQQLARNGKWQKFSKDNSKAAFEVANKLQQLMYTS